MSPKVIDLLETYGLTILIVISILLIYVSYEDSYHYIGTYLLDQDSIVLVPFRNEVVISVHDVLSGSQEHFIVNGLQGIIYILGEGASTYAIVGSRGFDIYVVVLSILTLVLYKYGFKKFKNKLMIKKLYPYTSLFILSIALLSSLTTYTLYINSPATEAIIKGPYNITLSEPDVVSGGLNFYLLDKDISTPVMICMKMYNTSEALLLMHYRTGNNTSKYSKLFYFSKDNNVYCSVIREIDSSNKFDLILVLNKGEQAYTVYTRVRIIYLKPVNIVPIITPPLLLVVTILFITAYSRKIGKPRSFHEESPVEKQLVEEAKDQSS